jgi:hypothetical protein
MLRSNRAGTQSSFTFANGEGFDGVQGSKCWNRYVNPYLRHLRGKLTLHAASVGLDSRAVAFAGPSGAGKSTIAAAVCKRGHAALLADDTVALEQVRDGFEVLPTEARHFLHEDSARYLGLCAEEGEKTENIADRVGSCATGLHAIMIMALDDKAPEPALRRLVGREAFVSVATQLFRFVLDEPEVDLRDFDLVSKLVHAVPIYKVTRTAFLSDLDLSVKLVLKQFGSAGYA